MKPISRYLDEAIDQGLAKNDSDIARKIGATRSTISSWRSGRRTPEDDQAVMLAQLLGKEPGELLAECGAARATSQATRAAWEKVAARMAGATLGLCVLLSHPGDAKAENPLYFNHLLFSEVKSNGQASVHACVQSGHHWDNVDATKLRISAQRRRHLDNRWRCDDASTPIR